ncbi:MAG: hypothetical protein HY737_05925 [Candidatus Omnitrophica bacterium]|nr:hypothetical protein [Candidatus Omnitrophota bacterium]
MASKRQISPWRIVGAASLISATFLWLTWVRAGAADDQPVEVAALPAEPAPAQTSLLGMNERVSLDLRSTDATDALKYLASKGGLNIAISKNVSGRVNLFLTDVPIRDVFELILRSNSLAYDRQGDVYNIMTEEEYRALYGKKFADLRQVRTFRLQYAIPQQAFNLLDTLKSEVGRLLVDEDTGTVMVMDTPQTLQKMELALATLEKGGMTRVIDLKYAKAKDVEERLKDQLEANKLGFVKADERSNQVILKTLPDRMDELEALIRMIDRKTREVLIDSKIVKVQYNDDHITGVDWDQVFTNIKFHGVDKKGDFRSAVSGTPPSEVPSVTRMDLNALLGLSSSTGTGPTGTKAPTRANLGKLAFTTINTTGYELFRYLQTLGKTQIISNPRLMVTENQEAKIHVGTREAYITSTTTTGQTTSTTAEDVQFIDVGIQLAVTPTINQDGFVTMKIKPEVSSVVRTLTTPSNNKIPIVDTSTAETNVMVADGTTVVLGGLRKEEIKNTDEQIPWLGHIPIIGDILFKQANHSKTLTELVVFITPHILGGEKLVTGDESGRVLEYRDYAPVLSKQPSRAEPRRR